MFRQIDGVSMGSPLGPIQANIFVGLHERRLFDRNPKPFIYLRYVDDTFVSFKSRSDALEFFWHTESATLLPIIYYGGRK